MKYFFGLLFSFSVLAVPAQIEPGYRPAEAVDMIALSNGFTFLKEIGSDKEIIPKDYKKVYDSETVGLDNRFQVYRNGNTGVVVFRGSTANPISWMSNIYSSMIPAESTVKINGKEIPYRFAESSAATVHSGYTLAVVLMADEVVRQINDLNKQGVHDIIITGHSLGGALATMFRAYLENLPAGTFSGQTQFKTYAFAAPMVGNEAFAAEYNRRFSDKQTAFSIVNPQDMIPSMPTGTGQNGSAGLAEMLPKSSGGDFRSALLAALFMQFNDSIAQFANKMGVSLLQQISGSVGEVVMPEPTTQYNYKTTGQLVTIDPVPYEATTTVDGEPVPEPRMYQHKPYIYYRSMLKMYEPERHDKLKRLLPPGM